MRCSGCGADNPEGASFCGACGSALREELTCPGCGRSNPPDIRFCHGCGARLAPSPPPTDQTPDASTPTSFAGGRYQVKKFLGEGGKKKAYVAYDTLLDREVAFSLIKTEGLDDAGRARVAREAQAMGRLGSHSHIVTVFDRGEADGQPYMVTELMGGGDIEGAIEEAPGHRVPLERAIEIAVQVCQGLEFAHTRGIVHRDIKPGNVWVTSEGVAKVGDFGLAMAEDRSRLTQEGMMVGTVAYMPPEQAMSGEVTAQADLYSLGAMLYELVTGRPPFLGDEPVAVISQHINTPPVAPSWHNAQCPRPLEALVLRLLAKDPSERPESAADVLAALEAVDIAGLAEPAEEGERTLDSLAGDVFVGRRREMGELKAALEQALSGNGRLVMLVGEPGIGKTRTAQELATYARIRGAQVLWGRCYEEQGVPPYWPWVQAIRSYVREQDIGRLRSEMGSGAAEIAEIVSDVREKLPGLKPPPKLDSAEAARFRLFDATTSFLKGAGNSQPLALVLDDLHWADQSSLLLLRFLARELAGSRLLLVGTYRDVELSRQHPLAETLAELTRERLSQRIPLRGLSQEDVGRFIEMTSGRVPPPGLVSAVHIQTEGNPLFVTEVVRDLVQEGELAARPSTGSGRREERESWTVRIPEGVREVIGRRLNRLSERCNQTLTIAAVMGREFELGQLQPLIEDITPDRLLEVLEEALTARVIEELPHRMGRYQFTHALIQETLVDELSLTRRVQLHARIAQALEEMYGADAEAHVAELARHFVQAEAMLGPEKVVHYSLPAGEGALGAYAYEEALSHFQRGLAAMGEVAMDSTKAALLAGLGRAQGAVAQWKEALANLTRAFDHYVESGEVARAVAIAEVPYADDIESGLTGASGLLGRALELLPSDSIQAGRLLATYGAFLAVNEGRYEDAREALDRALAIARREKDPALEMRALEGQLYLDVFWLKLEEARGKVLAAIDLARRLSDSRAEALYQYYATGLFAALGDWAESKRRRMASLAAAQKVRDRRRQTIGHIAVVHGNRWEGDWGSAREHTDHVLALSPHEIHSLTARTYVEYELGEFDDGRGYLERMVEARSVSGSNQGLAIIALVIPVVGQISGRQERFEAAEEAAGILLSSGSAHPFYVLMARTGLGLIAVERGDAAAAEEQYAKLKSLSSGLHWGYYMSTDRALGLLAQTMGRTEDAIAHFEEGLAWNRKAGYRPQLAWTCCDYADTLLAKDGPGDREKAMSLLDEALAISRELGMRPLVERVLSRRQLLEA